MSTPSNEALDLTLATAAALYALWLNTNKKQEPDWTWAEVVGGVVGVMVYAGARARNTPGASWQDYERGAWRGFVLAGLPIICGEVSQALEKKRLRDAWLNRQLGG